MRGAVPDVASAEIQNTRRAERPLGYCGLEPVVFTLGGNSPAAFRAHVRESGATARLPPLHKRLTPRMLSQREKCRERNHPAGAGYNELQRRSRADARRELFRVGEAR